MYPYTLIRTSRRSLALQISPAGSLVVRAPLRMSVIDIEGFIHKKSTWIDTHIQQAKVRSENTWLHTMMHTQQDIVDMKKRLSDYILPRIDILKIWKNIPPIGSIKITKSSLRWGSCSSRNNLCFSYRLADYMQPQYVLQVGTTDSLWVHTEDSSHTSLNPIIHTQKNNPIYPVIDAVILHELAHTIYHHHQKPFWDLLYSYMPDYDMYMRALKNGNM
jgi:predicted metal-dependent hydrolase